MKLLLVLFMGLFLCTIVDARDSKQGEGNIDSSPEEWRLPVDEIKWVGFSPSDETKSRASAFRGREYHPEISRQLLLLFANEDEDSYIEVRSQRRDKGVILSVESHRRAKIKTLVFKGNKEFTESQLKAAADYKDGVELDKKSIQLIQQRVQAYYNGQSFLASEIKVTYIDNDQTAVFEIAEGKPVLIGNIQISPLVLLENLALRRRYERDMLLLLDIKPGQRVVKEKVLEGIQRLKDWLRDHDFLMAKDPVLETKLMESGKIDLNVRVDYGYRIRFGFRGNTQFSYRELISFVREIKEVSAGTDYLESVKRKIIEAYKEIGLANVQITTLVHEDSAKGIRFVSLVISEGSKIKIRDLKINGINSLSEDEVRDKFASLATRLIQRGFFDESGLNKAGELLAEYLVSNGYLSARLEFSKFEFNQSHTEVSVTLLFNEGVQTMVDDVAISGSKSLSVKDVESALSLERGKPFNIFAFERGLVILKEKYQDLGHLSAQILNEGTESIVKYSRDQSTVKIQLDIDEGPIFRVGVVIVRGNTKTHARVITRELPLKRGDVLTKPLLNEAEDNLRKLNLFSSIVVRTLDAPGEDGEKDILILVEESKPGSIEVAPGYRTDLGLRLALGSTYSNLGGWNRSVSGQLAVNHRLENYHFPELSLSIGFREPYLAGLPLVFTSNLYIYDRQYYSFDANVFRITAGIKKELLKWLTGSFEYSYELVHIYNVHGSQYTSADARTDLIGAVIPGLTVDTRNDHFNPTRGFHSVNRFELATRFLGSDQNVGYYKATSMNSTYLKLWDDWVLALAANFGYERSDLAGNIIPVFKLFRMGGVGTVRGYAEDSIEVEKYKSVYGALAMIDYRAELRVPLSLNFGTVAFVDAGNLFLDRIAGNPGNLRSSVGTGFRYKTPVGPVALDVAYTMQDVPQVGDTIVPTGDRFRVHFAIGSF